MQTASVDVRKLQILNDRISQTIEALEQVRLSVHALRPPYAPWMHPLAAAQLAQMLELQAMQRTWGIGHAPWAYAPWRWRT